jgi:uncharacterized damage-inducible protein DinB
MTKEEIIEVLEKKHQNLFDWLEKQPNDAWGKGPEGKWTTGQHVLHLVNSIKLLNNALSYPKFILKYKFGVSNREARTYEVVSAKYHEKLIKHQDLSKAFNKNLKTPTLSERKKTLAILQIQNKKLQHKTKKWKDKELDTLLIPHPLMGRMTVREIIMWTAHHTAHHTETLIENY